MKRIVIKVGTAVVSRSDGKLALGRLGSLVEQLCELVDAGYQVLLVSSGAIGIGSARLGLDKPTSNADRQAAAAAGQGSLIALYDGLFRRQGRYCAQVLLTEADFHHRSTYLSMASALERLLQLGVVPVINENDVVSTAELALKGQVFGDNDRLSALVASNLGADLLLLLSNVDGLFSAPPGTPGATRIEHFDPEADFAIGAVSAGGRGGMGSKVQAARDAAQMGVPTIIASGLVDRAVWRAVEAWEGGEPVGTRFDAEVGMNRRRRWIAFATVPEGTLHVNAGARAALLERQASLLHPGVVAVDGEFPENAVVAIACEGTVFARGHCARSSEAVREALGEGRGTLVHRDELAILGGIHA